MRGDNRMSKTRRLCIVSIIILVAIAVGFIVNGALRFNFSDVFASEPEVISVALWYPHSQKTVTMSVTENGAHKIRELIFEPVYHRSSQSGYLSDDSDLAILTIRFASADMAQDYDFSISNLGDVEIHNRAVGGSAMYSMQGGKAAGSALYVELLKLVNERE